MMKEQLIKKLVKKGVGVLTAMVMVAGFTLPVFASNTAESSFYVEDFGTVKCKNSILYGNTAVAHMSVVGGASLDIRARAYSGDLGWYSFSNYSDWADELTARKYVTYGVTGVWAHYSIDDGYVSGSGTLEL
ncbi:MAG: hypothetical protein ACLSV0_07290 [Lachnospira eligens]|jgi:hypothetical protein|uniref:hypothetical protein n=1 Tax=Lachnospira eligens TaxID=39485 RepID=UPI003A128F29